MINPPCIPQLEEVDAEMTQEDQIVAANELAARASTSPWLRSFTADLLVDVPSIQRDGPMLLARWVRDNIRYVREAVGVEILQGPVGTMTYRIGDCDDLAILFVAMVRSIGIAAHVVGIGFVGGHFQHAIARVEGPRGSGRFVELTDDRAYLHDGHMGSPPPLAWKNETRRALRVAWWEPEHGAYRETIMGPEALDSEEGFPWLGILGGAVLYYLLKKVL